MIILKVIGIHMGLAIIWFIFSAWQWNIATGNITWAEIMFIILICICYVVGGYMIHSTTSNNVTQYLKIWVLSAIIFLSCIMGVILHYLGVYFSIVGIFNLPYIPLVSLYHKFFHINNDKYDLLVYFILSI